MVIDPKEIEEVMLTNFKGGYGHLATRNYSDGKCKIMFSRLCPGASSGNHLHENNCEIVYIISGTATFCFDGKTEIVEQGKVHYCPEGHSHYMKNETPDDVCYLAIVAEHHV